MANNQIYMKLLQHAYQCRETSCSLMPSCQQMKQIISHTELCEQKTTCPVCRQLRVQCRYHSNHCQDTKCPVSICASLKYKIKLEKLEERYVVIIRSIKNAKMFMISIRFFDKGCDRPICCVVVWLMWCQRMYRSHKNSLKCNTPYSLYRY